MSQLVYPSLPGLAWPVRRTPVWNTVQKRTASGRLFTARLADYPWYRIRLSYEFLRQRGNLDEYQTLLGFFNRVGGAADNFLFEDIDDRTVTGQVIGVGDGSTRKFQLVREFGGFVEPVYGLQGPPAMKLGSTAVSGATYTVDDYGLVNFNTAPASGVQISWSGDYFWRCHFAKDSVDFDKFMHDLFSAGTVDLETYRP